MSHASAAEEGSHTLGCRAIRRRGCRERKSHVRTVSGSRGM